MAGLVPAAMPRFHAPGELEPPPVPTVQRLPVLAWNATSNPPPANAVIDGLVPAIIPRPQLRFPAEPIVMRLPVLA